MTYQNYDNELHEDPDDGFKNADKQTHNAIICGFEATVNYYASDRENTVRILDITFDNLAESIVKKIIASEVEFTFWAHLYACDSLDAKPDDIDNEPNFYGHRDEFISEVTE